METASTGLFGVSHARLTAYSAVLLLCGIFAWNYAQDSTMVASNTPRSHILQSLQGDGLGELASNVEGTMPEGITPLGVSILAQSVLAYSEAAEAASSTEAGLQAVEILGQNIQPEVTYRTYTPSDIKTSPDVSKDRVVAYRIDLQKALQPLLENKEYEMDLYAKYIETKDSRYLQGLATAAANYRRAITNTEVVIAPEDAAGYQAGILTAMSKFASVLDVLIDNATDPFASTALLRTFLDGQDTMLVSFDSLAKYSAQKII